MRARILFALACLFGGATSAAAQTCLATAAPFLREEIGNVAAALAGPNRPDPTAFDTRLTVFALIDGLMRLQVHRAALLADTADTDKQTGASAGGKGTTSLVEQPSFAKLLALAVENGAIEKGVTGTQLTLSTTPYMLAASIGGDSAELFERYELLARLGLSAGFDLDPGAANPLDSVRQDQLREWSVRLRLTPDRSGRSAAFRRYWETNLQPRVQSYANALSGNADVAMQDPAARAALETLRTRLRAALATPRDDRTAIAADISCAVEAAVAAPFASGALALAPETAVRLRAGGARFAASLMDLRDAGTLAKQYFAAVGGKPQATVAVTHHRPASGTLYTEGKVVYEQGTAAARFVANAGASFYHDPDPALNQGTLRDVAAAVGLESKLPHPFGSGGADIAQTTVSFNYRFQHMREKDGAIQPVADVSALQFKVEVPLAAGLSMPLSFSVSNAADAVTEEQQWGSAVHFGLTFDADKLYALTKAVAP